MSLWQGAQLKKITGTTLPLPLPYLELVYFMVTDIVLGLSQPLLYTVTEDGNIGYSAVMGPVTYCPVS
jgi:hypothetical protein